MTKKVSVKQSVNQKQKVVVNIGTKTKAKAKQSRKPKQLVSTAPYVRYPNSIGYALNSQVYSLPAPKSMEYNSALANAHVLQAAQQKTGSLIPNQQVNSLYSTIHATPRQESLGDNPFLRGYESRNNQVNMRDPYESLYENVVEDSTTSNAYEPDQSGQKSVGVGVTLGDLPAGIVHVGADERLLLAELSEGLKGSGRSLGERISNSITSSITNEQAYERLNRKAYSDVTSMLDNQENPHLEERLGREVMSKKNAALGAVIGFPVSTFMPEERVGRGRKKGSKNKKVELSGIQTDEV